MRIAVLSDIHGNLPALEAVLAALKPYDAIWQLGDIVGYGPQPDEVVARLVDEGATGVRGNHDAAAIGQLDTDSFNDDARAAVEWTAERITPRTRDWLAALPERSVEQPFTLVHGSPRDPTWEYVFTASVARGNLSAFSTDHCLVGHTHIPVVYRDKNGRMEGIQIDAGDKLKLSSQRSIVNPGSVGQPRDGDPRASAMLLDTDEQTLEWRRVEYPIAAVQKLMAAHKLPARLARRLEFGL
ncbi:MAG TPA: metallophosphoesterase family protein [Candidatus Limnocylindrales bacterium]|jgi:predicted phosphodiesterase